MEDSGEPAIPANYSLIEIAVGAGFGNRARLIRFGRWASARVTNPEPDEMSRQTNRGRPAAAAPTPFDQARDELFQHVMRCGVIGSAPEHQAEWFDETMTFLADRYHELSKKQIADLRILGERFAAPTVKSEAATA